jgi:hypothetical protein
VDEVERVRVEPGVVETTGHLDSNADGVEIVPDVWKVEITVRRGPDVMVLTAEGIGMEAAMQVVFTEREIEPRTSTLRFGLRGITRLSRRQAFRRDGEVF